MSPSAPRSEPIACPICGRPMKWTPDQLLAAFECEHCGQFSDFGGAALPSEQRHHSQLSLPYDSAHAESPKHEEEEDD